MNTINFDEIPQHTKDYLAAATLAAIRRFAKTEEGKALKEQFHNNRTKETDVVACIRRSIV